MTSSPPIQLVALDIDGVLTEGEGRPLDLELMELLASLNRAARRDANAPAITLCTGRPAPYLEVMMQAIDAHRPGVYENGAGLYYPHPYGFLPHPAIAGSQGMPEVRQVLEDYALRSRSFFFQPGKIHTLTLFPHDPDDLPRLRGMVSTALGSLAQQVDLVYSTSCLNILPTGMDKGVGFSWLAKREKIPLESVLGMGDSDVDLPFLQLVGRSAAPANAVAAIRQIVDYVSPHPTGQGVRDILTHYGLSP